MAVEEGAGRCGYPVTESCHAFATNGNVAVAIAVNEDGVKPVLQQRFYNLLQLASLFSFCFHALDPTLVRFVAFLALGLYHAMRFGCIVADAESNAAKCTDNT